MSCRKTKNTRTIWIYVLHSYHFIVKLIWILTEKLQFSDDLFNKTPKLSQSNPTKLPSPKDMCNPSAYLWFRASSSCTCEDRTDGQGRTDRLRTTLPDFITIRTHVHAISKNARNFEWVRLTGLGWSWDQDVRGYVLRVWCKGDLGPDVSRCKEFEKRCENITRNFKP